MSADADSRDRQSPRLTEPEGEPTREPAPPGAAGGPVPVEALAADNQRLRDLVAAAGRLAEFGRFAAKQIHELRQPLFAIKGLAQLLLERQEVDVGEARDFARHIVEQAERLAGLVADLRRISLPGSTAKDGRTEVAPVVLRVAALLEWRFRKGVTLRTEIAPDLPPAAIGGGALEQVLINLLSNALDAVAGRPGPLVQVRVRTPAPGTIEIGVADNGCGIARPARARLFESFFTTKGEEQGTGLGLAVSREIARGAGGDLVLSDGTDGFSEPAVTVFRCTLLAARDASGARP